MGDAANPRVLVCVHGLTRTGRDFDALARALCGDYRVVCPDVAGRGRSDWLADPHGYVLPQYAADMVTLIARLNVEQVDWFGTSMGGLIGMALAGLPKSPVRKLLLNDVGPRVAPSAIERIGAYLGLPVRFKTFEEGLAYLQTISASFGRHTPEQWRELNGAILKPLQGAQGRNGVCITIRRWPFPSVRPLPKWCRPARRRCGGLSKPSGPRCWWCAAPSRTCYCATPWRRWRRVAAGERGGGAGCGACADVYRPGADRPRAGILHGLRRRLPRYRAGAGKR